MGEKEHTLMWSVVIAQNEWRYSLLQPPVEEGAGPQYSPQSQKNKPVGCGVGGGGWGSGHQLNSGVGESSQGRALDDQRGRERNPLVASTSLKRVGTGWLLGTAQAERVLGPEKLPHNTGLGLERGLREGLPRGRPIVLWQTWSPEGAEAIHCGGPRKEKGKWATKQGGKPWQQVRPPRCPAGPTGF